MTRTPAAHRVGAQPDARRTRGLARAMAAAGTLFAVLLVTALALVRQAPGLGVPDAAYTAFYAEGGSSDVLVTVGLHIVPFAGIAFLWYAVALRTLVLAVPGERPQLAQWLQFAAGIVLVCTMFVASALVGAVALLRVFSADPLPPPRWPGPWPVPATASRSSTASAPRGCS